MTDLIAKMREDETFQSFAKGIAQTDAPDQETLDRLLACRLVVEVPRAVTGSWDEQWDTSITLGDVLEAISDDPGR